MISPRMGDEQELPLPQIDEHDRYEQQAQDLLAHQRAIGLAQPSGRAPDHPLAGHRAYRPLPPLASVIRSPAPDLDALAASLVRHLAPRFARPLLALTPTGEEILARAVSTAAVEISPSPLEASSAALRQARSWLAGRQRSGTPSTILAPAWGALTAYLERLRLRFRLAPDSCLVWLGELEDLERDGPRLPERALSLVGVESESIEVFLDLRTVASPIRLQPESSPGRWRALPLPWTALEVVDDQGLPATSGRLAVFDLATRHQPAYQLTALRAALADGVVSIQLPAEGSAAGAQRPHRLPSGSRKRANRP